MAGLIDGNGYFGKSKEGYVSLEITNHAENERCLNEIKQYYGGSVKPRTGSKSVRYRLHDDPHLIVIISDLNGEIRNPKRIEQYKEACARYDIVYKEATPLTRESG
jgi:ubiquinol-cytochrome c reductase cytochrome b subunit